MNGLEILGCVIWGCVGLYGWVERLWGVKPDFHNLLLIPLWLVIGPIVLFIEFLD